MRQIGDESRCDRVVSVQEDDGNFSGRGLGRANAVVLEGDDQIDSLACEGSIDGQCLRFVGEVAEIEAQVFAVRIAEFIEGGSQRLKRWRYMVETDVACTDPQSYPGFAPGRFPTSPAPRRPVPMLRLRNGDAESCRPPMRRQRLRDGGNEFIRAASGWGRFGCLNWGHYITDFPKSVLYGRRRRQGDATPLSLKEPQWVLDSRPRRDTLAFQVDVWDAHGELPQAEADARQKEIVYSSRTRAATDQSQS